MNGKCENCEEDWDLEVECVVWEPVGEPPYSTEDCVEIDKTIRTLCSECAGRLMDQFERW